MPRFVHYVEEVFENKDGLYGSQTGKKYEKKDTEEINGFRWSKPAEVESWDE